jgi:predicted nucleic acid-binding protein
MNAPVTIDASVFVSAFVPSEPAHEASKAFMLHVRETAIPIIVPSLILPEISAALARGYGKNDAAKAFVRELKNLPNTIFADLDGNTALLSADIAADNRLRGSAAVYAAVALRFGTELVTLDKEQLDQLAGLLPVRAP